MLFNTRQLIFMHNFIRKEKINKEFVFVSEWMKNILEKDSLSKGKIKNYHIIPNVIDENVFNYIEKDTKADCLQPIVYLIIICFLVMLHNAKR